MAKETVEQLGERFLKKFEKLQHIVYLRNKTLLLCSLRLHEIFREFRKPVIIFLSNYESMEQAFENDPDWLDNEIRKSIPSDELSSLIFFVLGAAGNPKRVERFLADQLFALNQPIIPTSSLFTKKDAIDSIRDAVVQYVPARYFSPYQIHRVAAEKMFVGRKHLLNKICGTRASQIVVGPRRIGKSSLARHLERLLGSIDRFMEERDRMPRCSYVDVSDLGDDASDRIWHSILKAFHLQRKDFAAGGRIVKLIGATRRDDRTAPIDEAQALGSLITAHHGQLTIILDEVDRWIESEGTDGWPTLDRLRAMTDDGRAQVVLLGYESLALASENDHFPFTGRGNKLLIGPLEFTEVEQLVTEPIEELGLRFTGKEQIVNLIWWTTSGMPQIVQDICAHIVDQAFLPKVERTVTMSMVKAAIESAPTVRTFRHPLMGCPVPLAEAIAGVLSIVHGSVAPVGPGIRTLEAKASLTISDIATALEKEGYTYSSRDFELALAYLELRFILETTDSARTRWKWINDIARETMKKMIENTGQQRWMQSMLAQHKEGSWRKRYHYQPLDAK